MNIGEWVAAASLCAMIFGGFTKARTTLFSWSDAIDLGEPNKNQRLRVVIGGFFFSNMGIGIIALTIFILTGVGFDVVVDRLVEQRVGSKVEIVDASSLYPKTPYLGVVIKKNSSSGPTVFPVVNFHNEFLTPFRGLLIIAVSMIALLLFVLFSILGMLNFILKS